ncbi:MAG: alpha/beta hydrolase-fold protein, partial [Mucilaginibacter sp.]
MKQFLIIVFVAIAALSCNKHPQNNNITIGKKDSIYSKILGEERKLWIYLPADAQQSKNKYPVVYLLDGDSHFASVSGMVQYLNGVGVSPDMIVVAILNTDRPRDLTPTHSLLMPDGSKSNDLKTTGGGEKFISFLQKELIPHVQSTYPAAPYKMLIGHSLGGLTAMNILINHPDLFNAYVAIDPSMWWDNKKLLNQADKVFADQKFNGKSLFLGIANTMPAGMDTLQVRIDSTGGTSHIRSILQLKDILQRDKANGLTFGYKYYKDDDHGSVPFITEYDAFHFLFGYYKFPKDLTAKMYGKDPKFDAVKAISDHYADVSKHLGFTMLPPEDMVSNYAHYYYKSADMPERAYALLQLNLRNYPDSFNTNNDMGDFYAYKKDNNKALNYYNKALNIKDDASVKQKIDKLKRG